MSDDFPQHPISMFLDVIELEESVARTSRDIFVGSSHSMPNGRIFGGQVLAQALIASSRTIDDGRPPHSLHGYFLRPGDVTKPITLAVDRIHDGRSFARRNVQVYQDGVPIFASITSFQAEDTGFEHQIPMPDVPRPEDLPDPVEKYAERPRLSRILRANPIEIRHVTNDIWSEVDEVTPYQAVWTRMKERIGDDPLSHRAGLAYLSDFTIQEPVMRANGIPQSTKGMSTASLDHAIWWHRFARVDEWLLYVQESPSARGGRGLSLGRLYTRDGVLVATVAQEIMARVP